MDFPNHVKLFLTKEKKLYLDMKTLKNYFEDNL